MTLDNLINAFKLKFPNELDAFRFLYKRLRDLKRLDVQQCECVKKHRSELYKKYKPAFLRSPYTGGIGFPLVLGKYSNIVSPLPNIFYQRSVIQGVFADCKHCHIRYYIDSGTLFHVDKSPMRSRLALFLIAEYYEFSSANAVEILQAFKHYMKTTDLIKSYASVNLGVDTMTRQSLIRYRDKLIDPSRLDELKSYGLSHFLEIAIENDNSILVQ